MPKDIFEEICFYNQKYEANNYNGVMSKKFNFNTFEGDIPILLSAPHAVRATRDGMIKSCDMLTGGIVEYLCNNLGTYGIIRSCNLNDDPNKDSDGFGMQYKEAINLMIKKYGIVTLIDFHGCGDNHGFDVDIGTNFGKNINYFDDSLSCIVNGLNGIGKIMIDARFRASGEANISRYIHETSRITCYQIELSNRLRVKKTKELIVALSAMIEQLVDYYQKQGKTFRKSFKN